jgi:hypothetical protein
MADLLGLSMVQWARSIATTMSEHIREVEDAMLRNYKFSAMLQSDGRIEYNCAGRGFDWRVRFRNHPMEGNTGETTRTFDRKNLYKTAILDWRGYQATDAISERELQEAKDSKNALIKVIDGFGDRIKKSMEQGLAQQYLVDGNASGNEKFWHGLESFFGATQTVNSSTGAARTANAGDFVGYPNDTYAGLNTNLGDAGGSQYSGSVWPNGNADVEYDYWTPLLVNYTCTGFGGTADTWVAQGDEAMRFGIIHSQRNESEGLPLDMIWLARNLYYDFLNLIDGKEQIITTADTKMKGLGFGNSVMFDGVEVTWDTAIANNVGYGLNFKNIKLRCMYDSVVTVTKDDVFYDPYTQYINACAKHLGNLKFKSPRNFVKFLTLA